MKRKKNLKMEKGGFWDMTPKAIMIGFLLLAIASAFVAVFLLGLQKGFNNDSVVSEAVQYEQDVLRFKTKATNIGAGYIYAKDGVPMNAENLDVYTKARPNLNGTGASSYFCSMTNYGCKLKYSFSTGTNDEYWSLFIDGSEAFASLDPEERVAIEAEIVKAFQDAGKSPVVNHSATAVSATSTAVVESGANDGDVVFEIGNL